MRFTRRPHPPLLALGFLCVTGVLGCGPHAEEAPSSSKGFWFAERGARIREVLGTLGYAAGYEPAEERWSGLRVHDPDAAYLETFLFSSGHEPAAFALLPDGTIERRWSLEESPNTSSKGPRIQHPTQHAWRRIQELPGGDLLVIHEGLCLMRLAPDSTIRWRSAPGAHHDLLVDGDEAWVLDRTVTPPTPRERGWLGGAETPVTRDGLVRVSLDDGRVLERASLSELLDDARWDEVYREAIERARIVEIGDDRRDGELRNALDPLHANGLARLDPSRSVPTVFLREVGGFMELAGDLRRIDALRLGPFVGAHDPQLDPADGGTLLFDNFGASSSPSPASRILSISPSDRTAQVLFHGTEEDPFFSPVCGAVLPLPEGRLLVVESTAGRALQIDRSGRLLWEFRTPFRIPEEDLVAVLLDMRPEQSSGVPPPAVR
jgi:hypothetical protein